MAKAPATKISASKPSATKMPAAKDMTEAQREYERKRAAKAGMSLEKWLDSKQKQLQQAKPKPAQTQRKPGLFSRLIERANQPLKKKT